MLKKISVAVAGIVLIAIVSIFAFQAQIGSFLFERAVERGGGQDSRSELADGLHIALCGTGSPMPNADRAGPCTIVIAGDQMFVVDIGEGGGENIALMGFEPADLDGVLLTHFHSDHIDGLGALELAHWVRGANTAPLPIYGPNGVETVVSGINAAYAADNAYRTAHHGEAVAPSSGGGGEARPFAMAADHVTVLEHGGLTITAFTVSHDPVEPAVGYRFDYRGRSLCISGDTSRSANLERVCQGVDLLVHDALQPAMVTEIENARRRRGDDITAAIMSDIKDYHASPEEAAESAAATGAQMLVLSHIVPPLPSSYLYRAFLRDAASRFDGALIVGEDGMLFSLPSESEAIERSRLM